MIRRQASSTVMASESTTLMTSEDSKVVHAVTIEAFLPSVLLKQTPAEKPIEMGLENESSWH